MPIQTPALLKNPRLLAIFCLGFSSGLPLALTGSTLQAWFTEANISFITIGALSLLGIPYTLKFLWAPLMDHYAIPILGRRRGWILLMQLGLIIALFAMAQFNPNHQAYAMGVLALIIAFFSASQDIAYDAYRADILSPEERGLGAAYTVFAYRTALLVAGGLALVLADYVGWRFTYELMAGFIFICMIVTWYAPRTKEVAPASGLILSTISKALNNLLEREKIVLLLLFILLYKFGDALALSLMTTFLLKGLGFSLTEVGLAYKVVSFIATILGAFVGGLLLIRLSLYQALLFFGLAQAFSNLTFAFLALVGKQFTLMAVSLFIENFCSGLSTAALLAFMMSLCDHRYTASQFALLSALTSLGRVFLGPVAGVMVESMGWVQFYIWSFMLCFPSIGLLILLKDKVLYHASVAAD